jgi:hypothetical protein
VVILDRLFPTSRYLILSAFDNLFIWLLLVDAAGILVYRMWRLDRLPETLLLAALLLPLTTLAYYRNAFPYFYLFIMPPALVVCGLRVETLLTRMKSGSSTARLLLAAVTAGVVLNFGTNFPRVTEDQVTTQRRIVDAVHEMFPEPVPYIDRNSMIASFPHVGFFMSTWGMESYHGAGRPIFEHLLRTAAPKFSLPTTQRYSSTRLFRPS